MRVVVSHPGRQHSHQLAIALEKEGLLARYFTGVPCSAEDRFILPAGFWATVSRHDRIQLDPELVRFVPIATAARHAAVVLPGREMRTRVEYAGYRAFDWFVARRLLSVNPTAVVAYENAALATFRRARKAGLFTILDAASIHHAAQDRLHGFSESVSLHRRIVRRKDQEIELANHILTVSEFARETYVEAGVPAEKVTAVRLGADLQRFTVRDSRNSERFRFLFVGTLLYRKGVDVLVDAFKTLRSENPSIELRLVGGEGDIPAAELNKMDGLSIAGQLSQSDLAQEYQQADVFVLPSREDSFGMVVPEAMASGVPVIVSSKVGAAEMMTDRREGWIVEPGNVESLLNAMQQALQAKDAISDMRRGAVATAQRMTWARYHSEVVSKIHALGRLS